MPRWTALGVLVAFSLLAWGAALSGRAWAPESDGLGADPGPREASGTPGVRPGLRAQVPDLPTLHHVQLNTLDAEAAIDWYLGLWPDGRRTTVAGLPGVEAEMLLLFRQVLEAPPGAFDAGLGRSVPQSAFWHIGAYTNTTFLDARLEDLGVLWMPLWVGPDTDDHVWRSGLVPYAGMLTAERIEAASPAQPRPGGFGYVLGPDGALVELVGGPRTRDSFSHVHFFRDRPLCTANWYVEHLGMALPPRRDPDGKETPTPLHDPCDVDVGEPTWPSLERAGTFRQPRGTVAYGNGSMSWYPRQCRDGRCGREEPFAPSRGQVLDHVGFQVRDLDGLYRRLVEAGVTVLEAPHPFDRGRALMIQDPDGLAVELLELSGG